MCFTSLAADLYNTLIGVWDINHPKYGYRHVLTYENAPKNLERAPNCMMLHIPSKTPILPEHILDTSDCPDFFKSAADDLLRRKGFLKDRALGRNLGEGSHNYVIQMGIYHIAILNDLSNIKNVLKQIPRKKRPKINQAFINFFGEKFPDYPILLCCFNTKDAAKASPIMVHFAPQNPTVLQANTIESHGTVPDLEMDYYYHQMVLFSSYQIKAETEDFLLLDWSKAHPKLLPFLPKYGDIEDLRDVACPNMDLLIDLNSIRLGKEVECDFNLLPQFQGFQ